jgi:PAS domain S-box-containing protein
MPDKTHSNGSGPSSLATAPQSSNGSARAEWSDQQLESIIDTAHEAFVSIDAAGFITYWNPQAERTFGWSREEAIGRSLADTIIPLSHREAHGRGLRRFLTTGEGPALGKRFEMTALHREGHEFPVELTISAARSEGAYVFHAFLHDITQRKQAQQELELVRELALEIADAEHAEEGLQLSVRRICETTGLNAGQAWILNGDESRLVPSTSWFADADDLEPFRKASEEVSFEPGLAFVGKVWATGLPAWVEDVASDPECLRASIARQVGIGAALAVPVLAGDQVVAVMEFLMREPRPMNERLIGLLCAVTTQLGSLIQRKRAEDSLRKRELQLAQAQRVAQIGSWEWEIDRNEISWSNELYRIFELDRDSFEPSYEAFLGLVHPDDRQRVAGAIQGALECRAPFEFEHRLIRDDGASRIVRCHGEVLTEAEGAAVRMVGTCQDVTERRRSEEQVALVRELALSIGEAETVQHAIELALRAIGERTGWALGQAWIPAATGSYLECSAACFAGSDRVESFRRRSEAMTFEAGMGLPGVVWSTKKPLWMSDVRSDRRFVRAPLARETGLGAGLGVPVLAHDEVVAVLEFFVFEPCPEDEELVGVVSATAAQLGSLVRRKQTEEKLRRSEERFRLLVENVRDYALVMLDRDGHVESWNKGAERIVGYSAEEMVGYHISLLYSPDGVEQAEPELHLGIAAESGRYEESDWRVRKDGLRFWANVVITPLYEEDELRGFSYVLQDATERKRTDDELRRLSATVENSEDAIILTTSEKSIITSWNPAAERLFGYSTREVIGRAVTMLTPPDGRDAQKRTLKRVLQGRRAEHYETQVVRKNGSTLEVSLTVSPIKDVKGELFGVSMIARDITDRRRAELLREQAFGTYLDPKVADHILREGPSLSVQEAEVTTMFVDICDFMAFAEQFEPREVVATLNCLFELAVPIITSRGGHVDKFVGDGLLAIFGMPQRLPDHADRALQAALEIEELTRERFQGDLEIGIGIDSGTVVAGNVGGGGRLDFTVIGDAVNMASRVEAATRRTGDTILISEETRCRLGSSVLLEARPEIQLKGRQEPVVLFTPQSPSTEVT